MAHFIAPSVLAADFTNLSRDLEMINQSEADFLHVDVMDGVFVPAISFGQNIISQMKKICNKPFDVHLMIENPDKFIEEFVQAGADIITVHYESTVHLHRTLTQIVDPTRLDLQSNRFVFPRYTVLNYPVRLTAYAYASDSRLCTPDSIPPCTASRPRR